MFVTKQDDAEHHENREESAKIEPSDDDQVRKRQEQALMFEKYLEESGLSLSF